MNIVATEKRWDSPLKRSVEVHIDGKWQRVPMEKVRPGDVMRMFEPDGRPVPHTDGSTEWHVIDVPRTQPGGSWGVIIEV